jgi:hypothetical protein
MSSCANDIPYPSAGGDEIQVDHRDSAYSVSDQVLQPNVGMAHDRPTGRIGQFAAPRPPAGLEVVRRIVETPEEPGHGVQ